MKNWPADHPKAKLLARKRGAILTAAREQFLANGFDGTSMETIAAAADVSIMTLYRHAESKDDLFAAVIAIACDPDEAGGAAALDAMALDELLVITGVMFQQKLASPEIMALMRAVIAEQSRFPELAALAYDGTVAHLIEFVSGRLHDAPAARGVEKRQVTRLATQFADTLFGTDMLRTLLGIGKTKAATQQERAERATAELLAGLAAARKSASRAQ